MRKRGRWSRAIWRASVCAFALTLSSLFSTPTYAQGVTSLVRVVEELSKTPKAARLIEAGSQDVTVLLLREQPSLFSDPALLALMRGEAVYTGSNAQVKALLESEAFTTAFLEVNSGFVLGDLDMEIQRAAEKACDPVRMTPVGKIGEAVEQAAVVSRPVTGGIELDSELLASYEKLFAEHGIPTTTPTGDRPERVVMVSTHGYWGDPPPAGKPDTGGQTYWVLQVSKELAKDGRQVLILARHFEGAPRVEKFADNVWLVRIQAGGEDFIRKEELYPLVPQLAEEATAVATAFKAQGVFGHYADGMTIAAEVAARLNLPLVQTSHSLGVAKMRRMDMSPTNPTDLLDTELNYWMRNQLEEAAMRAANYKIANNPAEPTDWARDYNVQAGEHRVFPGGAGQAFFDVAGRPPSPDVLGGFSLQDTPYLFFWGRMSGAKNIEGLVKILGESRKANPNAMKDVKVVVAGGTPGFASSSAEEKLVKERVQEAMREYGLTESDVVFLGSQDHATIAEVARGAIAYVGPQRVEPFGMAAGEAMAAGIPILISKEAGIAQWLTDGVNAYIIDPENPADAATKLLTLVTDDAARTAMAERGQQLAVENFSWGGIANQQGAILDELFASGAGAGGRAFHRSTPAWRGDLPKFEPHHFAATEQLAPVLVDMAKSAKAKGERLIVALGGESGSGKSEIAQLMTMMLPEYGMRGAVVPGDAFFKLAPSANHANRVASDARGALNEGVGPQEVDLQLLDNILAQAKNGEVSTVTIPSDSRVFNGRRYADVPVDLDGVDIVFVDLTYSMMLDNAAVKVFLERTSLDNLDHVRARNLARDPDQDFDFVERVLRREHSIIAPTSENATLIVGKDDVLRPGPKLSPSPTGSSTLGTAPQE